MDASYQSKASQVETAVPGLSLTGYTDSAKRQLTELLEKTSTLPLPLLPAASQKPLCHLIKQQVHKKRGLKTPHDNLLHKNIQ